LNRDKIKSILNNIGRILGLLGLVFVLYKISKEYTLSSFVNKISDFKSIFIPLIALNLLSYLIGIYAWRRMMKAYTLKGMKYILAYYYFAKTEIAKYLPGNVFHFVGRQALASKIGLNQKQMAKISMFHMLTIAIGTVVSTAIFIMFTDTIANYIKYLMIATSIALLAFITLIYPTITKYNKLYITLLISISIAMQGFLLAIIVVWQLNNPTISQFFMLAGVFMISWLVGFVTPGASGGLGVREGAFIAIANFIHLDISSQIILFSIFFVRFINIVTDVVMYISTFAIKNVENRDKA